MNKQPFDLVREQFGEAVAAYEMAEDILKGRCVRIISDYNGQPFGTSKPSLRGQVKTVEHVHFDMQWGISLKLSDCSLFVRLDEVELV